MKNSTKRRKKLMMVQVRNKWSVIWQHFCFDSFKESQYVLISSVVSKVKSPLGTAIGMQLPCEQAAIFSNFSAIFPAAILFLTKISTIALTLSHRPYTNVALMHLLKILVWTAPLKL